MAMTRIIVDIEASAEDQGRFYADLENFITSRIGGTSMRVKITSDIK